MAPAASWHPPLPLGGRCSPRPRSRALQQASPDFRISVPKAASRVSWRATCSDLPSSRALRRLFALKGMIARFDRRRLF